MTSRNPAGPTRLIRSGQGAISTLRPAVTFARTAGRFIPAGQFGGSVRAGLGAGAGSTGTGSGPSGGGGTNPVDITSPWVPDEILVSNNSTGTLDFGAVATTVAATCFLYLQRGTIRAGTGSLEIWIDGTGTANIVPILVGDDCGINYTVDASSGNLILTATADNTGSDTIIEIDYMTEGVNAMAAWGTYEATRGTLVERGRFSVQVDGSASNSRRARGDNCGLTFSGSIATGQLSLTVAADGSDGNATAIVFDYDVLGANGTMEPWKKQAISVSSASSATASFETTLNGTIIWDFDTLTITANNSTAPSTYSFTAGDGCEHIWYYMRRGTRYEQGQLHLYDDLATGALDQETWDSSAGAPPAIGVTLSGAYNAMSTRLTLTCVSDNSDSTDCILYMQWIAKTHI